MTFPRSSQRSQSREFAALFSSPADGCVGHPELVRALLGAGHELGNHTWSHRDLTRLSEAEIRREFKQTDALLREYVPRESLRWWRAPFGARDARVLRIAGEFGSVSVYWTMDSLDSIDPPKSPSFLIERMARHSDAHLDGAIILMHVGEPATAEALPEILRGLQRRGFEIVTISRLVSAPASRRTGSLDSARTRTAQQMARGGYRGRALTSFIASAMRTNVDQSLVETRPLEQEAALSRNSATREALMSGLWIMLALLTLTFAFFTSGKRERQPDAFRFPV